MLHLDFLSLDRVAGKRWWDLGARKVVCLVWGFVFCFNFFRIFCLVFVISSIPERDKQHFQGEKNNHVIRQQRRVRASHPHVSFPTSSPPASLASSWLSLVFHFDLFSGIPLSPFVLPAWFLIGPSCPLQEIGRLFWFGF